MRAGSRLTPIRIIKLVSALVALLSVVSVSAAMVAPSGGAQHSALQTGNDGATIPDRSPQIGVEGWVKDAQNHPVSGANVNLQGNRAVADAAGYFSFATDTLSGLVSSRGSEPAKLDVSVSSAGYADWSISQVSYYSGDTLRVYPHLDEAGRPATHITAAQPHLSNAPHSSTYASTLDPAILALTKQGEAGVQFAVQAASASLPAQIRVYRTETGQVDVVPFEDYVKHVLPNEWVSTWAPDSLRAGAMAVKEYAWYWVSRGGKQPALGADVKDNTDDQVYDPNVSYASTDAAVDATWQYSMTRDGALFQASYCAGSYQADPSVDCPWNGNYMTQWGSKYYADQGQSWSWILRFYYPGSVVTPTPPGGEGGPIPTRLPGPGPTTQPVPVSGGFTVGQGATEPQIFQDAFDRNGGASVLGQPTGSVHWWLQYVSDHNVLQQPFSGPDGKGDTWLVFDTLKSDVSGIGRAYLLTGDIAMAYANHSPAGPEWIGAPTSDPYTSSADTLSQGFTTGPLSVNGQDVQFTPWPTQFNGWEADYFVGKPPTSVQTGPTLDLPGQPANIADVTQPDMSWAANSAFPKTLGVGGADWSAQFTRSVQVDAGSYDFVLSADSGVRLWVDGLLAINAWNATGPQSEKYNADLDGSAHQIRVQYYSPNGAAQLSFSMSKRGSAPPAATPTPSPKQPPGGSGPTGSASLRITATWLGRGAAPGDAWVQPLTLLLSVPGNPAVIGTYNGATDRNGVVIYDNLPAGIYDVHVKGDHNLQSARASIALSSGVTTDVDMKAMVDGDINGDNCVTIDDFQLVQAMVGTNSSTPGYDPRADLNGDGQVTLTDVSLLRSGFDKCGDISADNDLFALSTSDAADNAQNLAPWLNPDSLQKNLSLDLYSSTQSVQAGDIFQVEVVANAGTQPLDGGSFLLHYDPYLLTPLDDSGNIASVIEPGVALPSVLTDWVDTKGGAIGYAATILQGDPPSGQIVLTTLNFKALRAGQAQLQFAPLTSSYMEVTNGGVDLLGSANGLSVTVNP